MKHFLTLLAAGMAHICLATPARAQAPPMLGVRAFGIAGAIANQSAINRDIAARTTTTVTYRGQSYPIKRTPDDLRAGDAADRIARLETQLARCRTALLADSAAPVCPRTRKDSIWSDMRYLGQARPNWQLHAYRQELDFYQAEDARRRKAAAR